MARLTQFTRDDLQLDVRDEGPADGPVVILLHGFPADSTCWAGVEPLLHEAGLRTLAPDQRGYSPGARPRGVSAYRTGELVADVLALADAADVESFHLVGHDWGGTVAWNTAIAAPERVETLTALATPHPSALAEALRSSLQLFMSWYIGAFQIPEVPERLLAGRVGAMLRGSGLPKAVAERYGRRFARPSDLRGPINWYRAAARSQGLTASPGNESLVHVPTTYVWGSRDFALGRAAAERTAKHVAAPYEFVELDASHWLPEVEAPAVAEAIIDRVTG